MQKKVKFINAIKWCVLNWIMWLLFSRHVIINSTYKSVWSPKDYTCQEVIFFWFFISFIFYILKETRSIFFTFCGCANFGHYLWGQSQKCIRKLYLLQINFINYKKKHPQILKKIEWMEALDKHQLIRFISAWKVFSFFFIGKC